MAQVSQSKFKSWIFHKALSSKEADLKKCVSTKTGLLILKRFSFECRKVIGHFRVTLCLCFKTSLCANLSYEIDLNLHKNEHVGGMHFH